MPQELLPSLALPRSNIYRLLYTGFRYPAPLVFETFQNGEFLAELEKNISLLPHLHIPAIEKSLFINNLEGVTFPEFEVKFAQTFDTGSPLPPCPPYEGMYSREPRTSVMLEISEFYRHFGLRMSQKEGKRELPDHISAELEFLHFLTFREAAAFNEGDEFLKGYRLAQKDFLVRHPVRWVPEFRDKLRSFAGASFYTRLAEITSVVISQDLEFVTSNLLEKGPTASQVAYKNKFL
ncbi:MAG: molecular chaperone TorD family protein [Candidatus Methanoperedens sp.]|nr:molecular chaperone TorD family protein [Candidatus Methanoperedens sp.]MCZ7394804.1 molecular chaperone TorD family protein [Candidatus Methanoperedens sp.]